MDSVESLKINVGAEAEKPADAQDPEQAQLTWADVLETVLAHLRKFSAASVVDAVIEVLRNAPANRQDALGQFPWLLMLIAKWALQDKAPLRVGPKLPSAHLDELRNLLWKGGGQAHLERKARTSEINAMLMMRQILHCQMPFQQEDVWGLFRSSGLIDRLPKGHVCRRQYFEVMGMEPMEFVMLGIVIVVAAKSSGPGSLDLSMLKLLEPTHGKQVKAFLDLLAPSLPDLRNHVRKLPPAKGTRSRELYEFPVFKRYPLLRKRDGSLGMWHMAVVDRCVDEIVHLRLAQFGERYTQPFSRVFEDYVVELARATGVAALREDEYWERYDKKAKAVDVILSEGRNRVLIEAKMGLFHEDVLLQETEKGVRDQTPHLLRALSQGYAVSHQLASEAVEGIAAGGCTHYLIVVTSRDLLIGTGLMLAEICGPGSVNPDAGLDQQRLPMNQVFVMPILEYERLMESVATGVVDLFEVLRDAAAACQTLAGSRYQFHDYYRAKLSKLPMPKLISSVRAEAIERMAKAAGVPVPEPLDRGATESDGLSSGLRKRG
ncbi:hypothetical protein [Roseateles cavernae]|uniref:hypothetical protein n=1 Tax=Roseateles cavernae TaxID=3153578 RepID=UPI0032E4ABA7